MIHKAERYDIKGKDTVSGNCKYYINDLAFKNYLYSDFAYGIGYKLENLVICNFDVPDIMCMSVANMLLWKRFRITMKSMLCLLRIFLFHSIKEYSIFRLGSWRRLSDKLYHIRKTSFMQV